jgi:hypothetical protein
MRGGAFASRAVGSRDPGEPPNKYAVKEVEATAVTGVDTDGDGMVDEHIEIEKSLLSASAMGVYDVLSDTMPAAGVWRTLSLRGLAAKDLPETDLFDDSEIHAVSPYVHVELRRGNGKLVREMKTVYFHGHTGKWTDMFDVTYRALPTDRVVLNVYDHDTFSADDKICWTETDLGTLGLDFRHLLVKDICTLNHVNRYDRLAIADDIDTKKKPVLSYVVRFKGVPAEEVTAVANARRRVRHEVIGNKWFDRTVIATIAANCVTMAVYDYRPANAKSAHNQAVERLELGWLGIFSVEMLLKLFALGLCRGSSLVTRGGKEGRRESGEEEYIGYFADGWNWLDFWIVITGYLAEVPGVPSVGALRAFRVLRPLRMLRRIPELALIVDTLINSLNGLRDVFILLLFFFLVFAITGLQFWAGIMHQGCYPVVMSGNGTGTATGPVLDASAAIQLCTSVNGAFDTNPCPAGYECRLRLANESFPFDSGSDVIGFDDFGTAFLTVLEAATLAGWSDTMYMIQESWGSPAWCYFVLLVLLMPFFGINLVLAVIWENFEQAKLAAYELDGERLKELDRQRKIDKLMAQVELQRQLEAEKNGGKEGKSGGGSGDKKSAKVAPASAAVASRALDAAEVVAGPKTKSAPPSGPGNVTDVSPVIAAGIKRETKSEADAIVDAEHKTGERCAQRSLMAGGALRDRVMKIRDKLDAVDDDDDDYDEEAMLALRRRDEAEQVIIAAKVAFEAEFAYLKNKPPCFHSVRTFIDRPEFDGFIMFIIVLNTIALGIDAYKIEDNVELMNVLDTANYVFTAIFALEMVVKLVGLGPKRYAKDGFNVFDAIIVLFSLIELILELLPGGGGGGTGVSALRACRLLRMLKLAKGIKSLRILLATVIGSVESVFYMSLLVFLYVFVWAVVGCQLFAGQFDEDHPSPRPGFDNMYWSFFAVFKAISTDDWNNDVRRAVRAVGPLGGVYYFFVVLMGQYVVLSLFVAIILSQFAVADDEKFFLEDLADFAKRAVKDPDFVAADQAAQETGVLVTDFERNKHDAALLTAITEKQTKHMEDVEAQKKARALARANLAKIGHSGDMAPGMALGCLGPGSMLRQKCFWLATKPWFDSFIATMIILNCVSLAFERPGIVQGGQEELVLVVCEIFFTTLFTIEMLVKMIAFGLVKMEGAYLSSGWNVMDGFVVCTSLLSFVFPDATVLKATRALRPLRLASRSASIKVIVLALTAALPSIFNVLMLCTLMWAIFGILAVGFFKGALMECVACHGAESCNVTGLNETQCMSAPLNGTWDNPHSRHFDNLGQSMWTLFQVACITGWSDIMMSTVHATEAGKAPDYSSYQAPEAAVFFGLAVIVNSFFALNLFVGVVIDQFNRLKKEYDGSALLTEAQVKEREAQRFIRKVNLEPNPVRPGNCIRSIAFWTVRTEWRGCCFCFARESKGHRKSSVRVAPEMATPKRAKSADNVVPGGFEDGKARDLAALEMTEEQEREMRENASSIVPAFEQIILFLIMLNGVQLMSFYQGQSDFHKHILDMLGIAFTVVFAVEAVIKITGLGWTIYWRENWNRFDLFVVVISIVGYFLPTSPSATLAFRLMRIARLFRVIKRVASIQRLFMTLTAALPSLWNIACFLFVVFFVFAILGVNLFGQIQLTDYNSGLSRRDNFQDFPTSLITLFRLATGDGWIVVADGVGNVNFGGNRIVAIIYMLCFMLSCALVMVNLFIAVILENFGETAAAAEQDRMLDGFADLSQCWLLQDTKASGVMKATDFTTFMSRAPLPLGFGGPLGRKQCLRKLIRLDIPMKHNRAEALASRAAASPRKSSRGDSAASIIGENAAAAAAAAESVAPDTSATPEWCTTFEATTRAIAIQVVRLKIEKEVVAKEAFYLHHWYAAQTVQRRFRDLLAARRARRDGAQRVLTAERSKGAHRARLEKKGDADVGAVGTEETSVAVMETADSSS